jgi:glycosyl-4,4'-diaponeurosporenoate acyltransferase
MRLPVVDLTTNWVVAIDAAIWATSGIVIAVSMSRAELDRFTHDNRITHLRGFEDGGRVYRRIGLHRWKDHLPEAGALAGGMSKRTLPGISDAALDRFAAETRRGELTHWYAMAPILIFPFWNPAWLLGVMAIYALAANMPCILVQRYNRARIERALHRFSRSRPRES